MSRELTELLYSDNKTNLDHPDSSIRLASVVHRFRVPRPVRSVNFQNAFFTVGSDPRTRSILKQSDETRERMKDSCTAVKLSAERIITDSSRYLPTIHTLLISCKVQPEYARLDERLLFEWKSGIEHKPLVYSTEAIMYDYVMTIVTTGLGYAVSATENSIAGEFVAASRDYANAAGVFHYLASETLPQWITKSTSIQDEELPSECHPPTAQALSILFMTNGQQMAIATLLMKDGKPNYSLVAKLCYGVYESFEEFMSMIRQQCPNQKPRIDPDFFTLITLQMCVQKSLSLYFQARAMWDQLKYGIAIALLSEATLALKSRDTIVSEGVPDVKHIPALIALKDDLQDLRQHLTRLLSTWEKDNNSVYFTLVPTSVPTDQKITSGIRMNKRTEYQTLSSSSLEETIEPVLLATPETTTTTKSSTPNFRGTTSTSTTNNKNNNSSSNTDGGSLPPPPSYSSLTRSDSDLARELQRQFNLEG